MDQTIANIMVNFVQPLFDKNHWVTKIKTQTISIEINI